MTGDTLAGIAERLNKSQRRLVLAMPNARPVKWRALYRHAKVRHWTQLPFSVAHPVLDGTEILTPLGLALKTYLQEQPK